jgi:hypothetical protein
VIVLRVVRSVGRDGAEALRWGVVKEDGLGRAMALEGGYASDDVSGRERIFEALSAALDERRD